MVVSLLTQVGTQMASEALPAKADVVIIGSGIVGCSTAYFLAKRGVNTVVVEKGSLTNEQSSRNWGWLRQQGRNAREIPLAMFSLETWNRLSQELDTDIEFIQQGSLKLAYTEEEMAKYEAWTDAVKPLGLNTAMLSAKEVKEKFPFLEGSYLGAAFTPGDGQAEPRTTTESIARAAMEKGVKFYTQCAVEGIELSNGSVTSVVTERGEIKADTIVCAAGAWSTKLAQMVGLYLPQTAVRATVSETTAAPLMTHTVMFGDQVALRQKRDGTLYIAGGQIADYDITLDSFRHIWAFLPSFRGARRNFKLRVGTELVKDTFRSLPWSSARKHPFAHAIDLEPKPNPKNIENSLRNLLRLIPSLGDVRIQRTWAGQIDVTPDATPVLGEAPGVRGLVFATGFSGHGFTMGPGAGLTTSELILDGKTTLDIHPLRFSRFREKDLANWTII